MVYITLAMCCLWPRTWAHPKTTTIYLLFGVHNISNVAPLAEYMGSPEDHHKIFVQCHERHRTWVTCACHFRQLTYEVLVWIGPIEPWVPQFDRLCLAQVLEYVELGDQLPCAHANLLCLCMQECIQAAEVPTEPGELCLPPGINGAILLQDAIETY